MKIKSGVNQSVHGRVVRVVRVNGGHEVTVYVAADPPAEAPAPRISSAEAEKR